MSEADRIDIVLAAKAGHKYIVELLIAKGTDVNALSTLAAPFPVAPVTTDPVEEVKQKVAQMAGAFPRDDLDRSLVESVMPIPSSSSDGVTGFAKEIRDRARDTQPAIENGVATEPEPVANDP